jgi:solute carrier family 25 carnitine/acylcarnitine transporter 20/29
LVLAGHPFDTIKVRVQKEGGSGKFKGPRTCLKQTVQQEGMLALYTGVTPPLLMTGVINSMLVGMQGLVLHYGRGDSTTKATPKETAMAAVVTGFFISIPVTPMEGIKARLQVQYGDAASKRYAGPVDCARKLVSEVGVRKGLFRGWAPTAFCRMSNYSYFGAYAYFCHLLNPGQTRKMSFFESIMAGGGAGIAYWFSCYPFDVVKNKMMTAPDSSPPLYRNMRHCFSSIYKTEGVKGFFRGFTPCVLRAFPANAACFATFELAMKILPKTASEQAALDNADRQ